MLSRSTFKDNNNTTVFLTFSKFLSKTHLVYAVLTYARLLYQNKVCPNGNRSVKCHSQGRNDVILSAGTKPAIFRSTFSRLGLPTKVKIYKQSASNEKYCTIRAVQNAAVKLQNTRNFTTVTDLPRNE